MFGFAPIPLTKNQRNHVLRTTDPAALIAVKDTRYNLAIYTRPVNVGLENAVDALMKSSFKGIDRIMECQKNQNEILTEMICVESETNGIMLLPLVNDIAMCCESFIQITQANTIRLLLKVVDNDACRKFHIDGYTYRLLCTYHGPGTEWVYNDNVNRKYLGDGENDEIIKDWSAIQRLNTFDIAILKGELPYQRNGKGIVHRSPPIEHTNESRLVLRIDYTT